MKNIIENKINNCIIQEINNYKIYRLPLKNDKTNIHYINKVIDKIYIINLETSNIRRNYIIRLCKKYSINAEIIIVNPISDDLYLKINNKNLKKSEIGCYLSHMYCLNDAIINNYNKIIIFEDDIILHKNFCEKFREIDSTLDYNILFLGSSDFSFSILNSKLVNNNIYIPDDKSKKFFGAFSICYTKNIIKNIFKFQISKGYCNYDEYMIKWKNEVDNKLYVCWPNLVIPDLSTTNLEHNFWFDNEKIYSNYINFCYGNSIDWTSYNILYLILLSYIILDKNISYKENIINGILNYVKGDINKKNIIMKHINFDFFSNFDLEYILKN